MQEILSELNKGILNLKGVVLVGDEFIELLANILDKNNQIQELEINNLKLQDSDWLDLMKILIESQNNIQKITLINIPFHTVKKLSFLFFKFAQKQKELSFIKVQSKNLNSIHYGQIFNLAKNSQEKVVLDLSNCEFSGEEEINLKKLSKHENISQLILEGSNLAQELAQNLNQVSRIMEQHPQLQSMIKQGIEASTLFQDQKKLFLHYSTDSQMLKPKIYVLCQCNRKVPSSEIFNCKVCQDSHCNYCTKSEPYCYTCFGCGKSQLIQGGNGFKNSLSVRSHCSNCYKCPICMNILSNKELKKSDDDLEPCFFYCKFCFWNSKNYLQASATLDDLQKENLQTTNLATKNLTMNIKNMLEIQKKMNQNKLQKELLEIPEKQYFQAYNKKKEEAFSSEKNQQKKADNSSYDLTNIAFNKEFVFEKTPYQISPFNKEDNEDLHEVENPIFYEILKSDRFGYNDQFIEKYKENSYNLRLFLDFPIRLYRSKKEYLIPPMRFQLFSKKNCNKCQKSLCQYVLQEDSPLIKNNSFFQESNITYQLVKIYPLQQSEDQNSYRILMKLMNLTVYNLVFKLECLENCKFADGRQFFEKSFGFTKNNINLNSLSADIDTITDKNSPILFIDFSVSNEDEEVSFTLKQTKTIQNSSNEVKISDNVYFNFGNVKEFFAYLETNKTSQQIQL